MTGTLSELARRARQAGSDRELGFLLVNDTLGLAHYRQAALWLADEGVWSLSGVVQVADRFMVLFCEGFTEAAKVTLAEVHDELYADIFEKKQRIEMSRYFSHLREGATIDNFLAGTSQSPVEADRLRAGGRAKSTLSQSDAAELALPRSGSLKAAAGTKIQPENGSGVLPTSFNAPITPAPR